MDKFYYAQLNDESICIGISELSGEVNQPNMIKVEKYDPTILGKKYITETQAYEEIPKTKEQLLEELKTAYLKQVRNADMLGDIEEKNRLQQEYLQKKIKHEQK